MQVTSVCPTSDSPVGWNGEEGLSPFAGQCSTWVRFLVNILVEKICLIGRLLGVRWFTTARQRRDPSCTLSLPVRWPTSAAVHHIHVSRLAVWKKRFFFHHLCTKLTFSVITAWPLCFSCLVWAAPEVLSGGPYSHAADWWSLGILLFALVTGKVMGHKRCIYSFQSGNFFHCFIISSQFPVPAELDHIAMLSKVRNCHYVVPESYSSALILLLTEVCILHLNIRRSCAAFMTFYLFHFLFGGAASL